MRVLLGLRSKTTSSIVETHYRDRALADIAAAQVKVGDLDSAIGFVETISNSEKRLESLLAIALAYAESDQISQGRDILSVVLDLADLSEDDRQRPRALISFAIILATHGDFAGAREMLSSAHDSATMIADDTSRYVVLADIAVTLSVRPGTL